MTLNSKIILFFLALSLFAFIGDVHAQENLRDTVKNNLSQLIPESSILPDVRIQKKTHPERIIFTHIKLAGDQANIDTFAKLSPRVAMAQDIDKTAMALAEYNRIGNSFSMHDEKKEIVVHTLVEADEYSSLQNMIKFDEFDATTYFQFKMYDHLVGIVPENIERFSGLSLSPKSAERFFNILNKATTIKVEFILTPVYSDNTDPININGEDIWLMFTRIGEFRLWSNTKEPELLWYYRAPWYEKKDNSDIYDLYTKS